MEFIRLPRAPNALFNELVFEVHFVFLEHLCSDMKTVCRMATPRSHLRLCLSSP